MKSSRFAIAAFALGIALMVGPVNAQPTQAAGDQVNLVQNPGFETGVLSPWGSWNNSVVASSAHSGTYSMRVGRAAGSGEQTIYGLSPNTSYVLTGWVQTSKSTVAGRIGVKNHGGTETFQTSTSTAYTQLTVSFTTGTANTSATIYCYKPTSNGYVYCDDFNIDGTVLPPGPGEIAPTDPNIEYIGRWDKSDSSNYISNWGGAYLRVSFTGQHVQLKLAAPVNLVAKIDGAEYVEYRNVPPGPLNLTPTALDGSVRHTLVVNARFEADELNFQGLILDENAYTVEPNPSRPIVEFIGDSITAGHMTTKGAVTDYAWLTGEALGCDHTQIAFSGVTLVSGYHYRGWNVPGMDVGEFKQQHINHCVDVTCANVPAWDFTKYDAKMVVINLGTNDAWVTRSTPSSTFQHTMTAFLENVRAKYPLAEIFVMRTFAGVYVPQTQAAVDARIAAGDHHVQYIDTTGWLAPEDYNPDGGHPNDGGHVKIAEYLVERLPSCR